MAQKNVLSLDFYRRRIYTTTDSMTTVLGDAYFNPFRQELEVNEVITVNNGTGRYKIIVTQIDPYVTSEVYQETGLRNDITDLQSNVGELLSGNYTPPTPPTTTNTANYSIFINANTLNFGISIDTGTSAATRIYCTLDDATAPTLITDGKAASFTGLQTFPSLTYLENPASSTASLTTYGTAEACRTWVLFNDTLPWVQALASNGDTTIDVQAVDTLAATISWALSLGTDTTTQLQLDGTITDVSGVGSIDAINTATGAPFATDIMGTYAAFLSAGTRSTSVTLDAEILASAIWRPGDTVAVSLRVSDLAVTPNSVTTESQGVTLTSNTLLLYAVTPTPTLETGGPMTVRVYQLDANGDPATSAADTTFTVSTPAYSQNTAVATTNFTALSASAGTITAGNTYTDISITLVNNSETENLRFQFDIDPGSAANASDSVSISTYNNQTYPGSVFCDILASAAATGVPTQEGQVLFDTSAIAAEVLTLTDASVYDTSPASAADMPAFTYGKDGGSETVNMTEGDTGYVAYIDATHVSLYDTAANAYAAYGSGGATGRIAITAGGGTENHVLFSQDVGDQVLVIAADNYGSLTPGITGENWTLVSPPSAAKYSTTVLQPGGVAGAYSEAGANYNDAPKVNFVGALTQTGSHKMAIRCRGLSGQTENTFNGFYEGSFYHSGTFFQFPSTSSTATSNNWLICQLVSATSFSVLTTGQKTVSVGKREAGNDIYVDGIKIAPAAYDLSNDTEVASRIPSGTASDSASNPTQLQTPGSGTTNIPTTLVPADTATGISPSIHPYAFWQNATAINIDTHTVVDSGANPIGHTININGFIGSGANGIGAYAGPYMDSPLTYGETYTWTMAGSVTDATGTNDVDVSASFTVIDNIATTGNPLQVDYNSAALGLYTETDLRADFNVNDNGYNDTVHGPEAGWQSLNIVNSPSGAGSSSRMMRAIHYAGYGGMDGPPGSHGGFRWRADVPAADEYYFAYDVYLPSLDKDGYNWFQPLQWKMPALINGTLLEASHEGGSTPQWYTLAGFNARFQLFSNAAYGRGDRSMAMVVYDKHSVQQPRWCNYAASGQYIFPLGRKVTLEQRVKVNTKNVADGILQCWADGVQIYNDTAAVWRADTSFVYQGVTNQVDNSTRKIDGVYMYSYYGGDPTDPRNKPPTDQYQFYDNFIISTSRIYP